MNNQDLNIELFDRYLRHELNEAELAEFDENLLNDDEFNAAFIAYKTIALGIRDYGKAELKDYLKKNGKVIHKDGNFRISKMVYAMAASLIIFAGLYIVVRYYVNPEQTLKIATNESVKEETAAANDTLKIVTNELVPEYKAEQVPVIRNMASEPPPPISESLTEAEKSGEADMASGRGNVGVTDDVKDLTILSDYKTSDTILLVMNLYDDDLSKAKNYTQDKYATQKKALPSSNNNYSNADYSKKESKPSNDTNVISKKKSIELNQDKYTIEFWQSPVNFKGYKMVDKTIQLYGLPNKNIKLVNYNNKLYLNSGSSVYVLAPCVDGCVYKPEVDENIINLILNK